MNMSDVCMWEDRVCGGGHTLSLHPPLPYAPPLMSPPQLTLVQRSPITDRKYNGLYNTPMLNSQTPAGQSTAQVSGVGGYNFFIHHAASSACACSMPTSVQLMSVSVPDLCRLITGCDSDPAFLTLCFCTYVLPGARFRVASDSVLLTPLTAQASTQLLFESIIGSYQNRNYTTAYTNVYPVWKV